MDAINAIKIDTCADIIDYPGGNQVYTEYLLLCQALALAEISDPLEPIPIPTQERALLELHKGHAHTAGFTFWKRSWQASETFVTEPTIGKGEFVKALYTKPEKQNAYSRLSLKRLRRKTVVVNANWSVDMDALSCFQGRYISGANYPRMLKMVNENRVDMILHNLAHKADFVHTSMGVTLVPVKNVLVAMPDSLHYLVSRKSARTQQIYDALQKGLTQLKAQRRVKSAYEAVAFFDKRVKDWQVIKCL